MTKAIVAMLIASFTALSAILGSCQQVLQPPPPPYDYSQPVPGGDLLGEEWFDDSAIIGHSLMEGFEAFAEVYSNIHYFTGTGISAAGSMSYAKFTLPDGGTGTLRQGLEQRKFSKIYVMLGVNEITASSNSYKDSMSSLVDLIREVQGDDVPIYLLSITPTTKKKSDSSPFNKENVLRLNTALQEVCQEKECYYVDLFSCFADEDGYLPADKSTDGVHLRVSQYQVMAQYIQSHTVAQP